MRIKLLLIAATLLGCLSMSAQRTGVKGVVVDGESGSPVAGANVIVEGQNILVVTGASGDFLVTKAKPGKATISVVAYGYKDYSQQVEISANVVANLGTISIKPDMFGANLNDDMLVTESMIEDEEGNTQTIGALVGANDNVYYQATSYDFNIMRFRYRGYDRTQEKTYINGINFNEPIRGQFNYSMLGGMNNAFRNKTVAMGISPATVGFGGLGGTTNIQTYAKDYSPGTRASVAYTNGNYYLRGMLTYSTGLSKSGWAFTGSAIVRYSNEGVQPGTFYHSGGLFMSLQKVLNDKNSLSLTLFGAPTQRASSSATYEEAYSLVGNNLYNPQWGYQMGKKRSAKVVESFDPTVIFNWVWTPKMGTTLNTGFAFRASNYASTGLSWYNVIDPRPDYYRYLPSYYTKGTLDYDYYTSMWQNDESARQIDWDGMYQANYLSKINAEQTGKPTPSASYVLENRHSNQRNYILNSTLNTRLTDHLTLQGGLAVNYTKGIFYKTMKDLLGGEYWRDIDQYAERDFPNDKNLLQNDMNNPDRKVYKGDKFGYDYDINVIRANVWLQNMINLPKWDINYAIELSHTAYQREGHMRNGRAPQNSYGKGKSHDFDNGGVKVGATYKLDGRNYFVINGSYITEAPIADKAYISPRIKDNVISNLESERILSADLSYVFNYRGFRGSITGFWTEMYNGTQRYSFYDDQYSTFMNYVLTNVHRSYRGIEVGVSYKVVPSVTLSAAGTYSRYQYKNRPTGTRSYENGQKADTTQIVYLKNYYVGGTPQQAYNFGIDWAAPHNWYFGISATWMGDSYVDLSPVRHEYMPNLYKFANSPEEIRDLAATIATQEKLKNAFTLNASIGKVVYLNRTASLNINVNVENLLNNRNIQTGGYQQGRFDYTNLNLYKFPNKIYYAQGIKVFANIGVRF